MAAKKPDLKCTAFRRVAISIELGECCYLIVELLNNQARQRIVVHVVDKIFSAVAWRGDPTRTTCWAAIIVVAIID